MSEKIVKLSGIHKAMSKQMQMSWTNVPQFQLESEIDCTEMMNFRKDQEYHPSYTAIIAKAVGDTLVKYPCLNASWKEDHIIQYEDANVGIAVDTARGLLVPVIQNVNKKSLYDVHLEIEEMKIKAGKGIFRMNELTGGTFTISNLGMYRINAFNSIVNAPQAAILAIPRITTAIAMNGEEILQRKIMRPVLSVDHRVTDGANGARFITDLAILLENPSDMI